jgi:hypothetical protein
MAWQGIWQGAAGRGWALLGAAGLGMESGAARLGAASRGLAMHERGMEYGPAGHAQGAAGHEQGKEHGRAHPQAQQTNTTTWTANHYTPTH